MNTMTFDTPLSRRTLGGLALVVMFVMASRTSCLPRMAIVGSDREAEKTLLERLEKQPEAREWIRNNAREGPLASNRFQGRDEALAFVDALYEAGAVRVVVEAINDDKIEMAEGGPYADALLVRMPADRVKRQRLIAIVDFEDSKGGQNVADVGRETIYFWWD